ncbi:MAG: hypothetical protein ACLFVO_14170 [Chloroflexaceae bacterium]
MLPQANRASTWANVQFVEPPRKSCHEQVIRSNERMRQHDQEVLLLN